MSGSSAPFNIRRASDHSLLVTLGEPFAIEAQRRVDSLWRVLSSRAIEGVLELVPAYGTLLVRYRPDSIERSRLEREIEQAIENARTIVRGGSFHEVPVQYGGARGLDLLEVAQRLGIDALEVARLHSRPLYQIAFLGFAPGFPYLIGLPAALEFPRRPDPRPHVAAGTVAIAGKQTGIYPSGSPGGWHCLGGTDLQLIDPLTGVPLFAPGDEVRFTISAVECGR